jgi:hypothetical protein
MQAVLLSAARLETWVMFGSHLASWRLAFETHGSCFAHALQDWRLAVVSLAAGAVCAAGHRPTQRSCFNQGAEPVVAQVAAAAQVPLPA